MLTLLLQAIVVDAFLYTQLQQATKEIAFPPELQQLPPRELVLSSALIRKRQIMMWPRPGPPSGLRGKAETGEGC